MEREPEDDRALWRWLAVGCAGVFLVGMCLVPPVVVWLMLGDEADDGAEDEPAFTGPDVDPALVPDAGTSGWLPTPVPSLPPPRPVPSPAVPPRPTPPTDTPRAIAATVESADGVPGIAVGASCELAVTRHPRADGTFWCRAEIRCAAELIYGAPDAGYFDCTLYQQPERHVVGEDPSTTSTDRDPAMRLDTLRQELVVRDDATGSRGAFTVRARVTSVQ